VIDASFGRILRLTVEAPNDKLTTNQCGTGNRRGDVFQKLNYSRREAAAEDVTGSDGDSDECETPNEDLEEAFYNIERPAHSQATTIVFKGLQRPLSIRGGKLDVSDVFLEFPSNLPLADLGEALQSRGERIQDRNALLILRFSAGYQFIPRFDWPTGKEWGSTINTIWKDYDTDEVVVTSGKSCFSRSKGLKINHNQTLASFFSQLAPAPMVTELVSEAENSACPFPDTLKVRSGKERSVDIAFMRTIRVPDNGKVQNLPPGLGRFPLFNISSFQERLPQEMADKGGIFFPIYRES